MLVRSNIITFGSLLIKEVVLASIFFIILIFLNFFYYSCVAAGGGSSRRVCGPFSIYSSISMASKGRWIVPYDMNYDKLFVFNALLLHEKEKKNLQKVTKEMHKGIKRASTCTDTLNLLYGTPTCWKCVHNVVGECTNCSSSGNDHYEPGPIITNETPIFGREPPMIDTHSKKIITTKPFCYSRNMLLKIGAKVVGRTPSNEIKNTVCSLRIAANNIDEKYECTTLKLSTLKNVMRQPNLCKIIFPQNKITVKLGHRLQFFTNNWWRSFLRPQKMITPNMPLKNDQKNKKHTVPILLEEFRNSKSELAMLIGITISSIKVYQSLLDMDTHANEGEASTSGQCQFGGVNAEGETMRGRACSQPETRDLQMMQASSATSIADTFKQNEGVSLMLTKPENQLKSMVIPDLPAIDHYGDKVMREAKWDSLTAEGKELMFMTTHFNRYLLEIQQRKEACFPVSQLLQTKMETISKDIQTAKPILDQIANSLETNKQPEQAKSLKIVSTILEHQEQLNEVLYQSISTLAHNTEKLTDVVSRQFVTLRNLVSMGGEAGLPPQPSHAKKSKHLSFPDCTAIQKQQVQLLAFSLGRDSVINVDPFDISLPCSQDVVLPILTDIERQNMEAELLHIFDKPTQVKSLEQGIMLLQARVFKDADTYEALLQIPELEPDFSRWDFWRILITDFTENGLGEQIWEQKKTVFLRELFEQWINTAQIREALMKLHYLYDSCVLVDLKPQGGLQDVTIAYTGFYDDWWGVGWGKWRFEHKIQALWNFPPNHLGELIKKELMDTLPEYENYKSGAEKKPPHSELGKSWAKLKQHAEELAQTWIVTSPQSFTKVKTRVPGKYTSYPGKKTVHELSNKWGGQSAKRGRRTGSVGAQGYGHGFGFPQPMYEGGRGSGSRAPSQQRESRYDQYYKGQKQTGFQFSVNRDDSGHPIPDHQVIQGSNPDTTDPTTSTSDSAVAGRSGGSDTTPFGSFGSFGGSGGLGRGGGPRGGIRGGPRDDYDGGYDNNGRGSGRGRRGASAGRGSHPIPRLINECVSLDLQAGAIGGGGGMGGSGAVGVGFHPPGPVGSRGRSAGPTPSHDISNPRFPNPFSSSATPVQTVVPAFKSISMTEVTAQQVQPSSFRGSGILSHPVRMVPHSPGNGIAFYDHYMFDPLRESTVDPRMREQEGRQRRMESKCSFILPEHFHRTRTVHEGQTVTFDAWAEYRNADDPPFRGTCLQQEPLSDVDPRLMTLKPKVLEARAFAPAYRVKGLSGKPFYQPMRWPVFRPQAEVDIPRLPNNLRIPVFDVASALAVTRRLPMERVCNFGYMGDSTLPGIANATKEWIDALPKQPGAPIYGNPVHVFGHGKTMYEIFNVPPRDSSKCNFLVFKFQNDFNNLYGLGAKDAEEKNHFIDMGLQDMAREVEHLIHVSQTHCRGASLIFIGMNPINTDQRADFMSRDPHAMEFCRRVDDMYRKVINSRCDVHYVSVWDLFDQNRAVLDPATCSIGAHLTKIANFFVGKQIRRIVMAVYACRANIGLGDITRFTESQAANGNMSTDQEKYCKEILGLQVKNVEGGGQAGPLFR